MSKKTDPTNFLVQLENGNFLSKEIVSNLQDCYEITDSDGYIVTLWSISDSQGFVVHKIKKTVANKELIKYHYQAYEMVGAWLENKLTLDEGMGLAMTFIKEFRPDLTSLTWTNGEWNPSIYSPNNIEAWVADDGIHQYGVMVNLNSGDVVYFSRDDL